MPSRHEITFFFLFRISRFLLDAGLVNTIKYLAWWYSYNIFCLGGSSAGGKLQELAMRYAAACSLIAAAWLRKYGVYGAARKL